MRPSFLDEMSWRMAEVYAATTDQILINLARHFKRLKPGDPIPGAFQYQAARLAELGQVNRETVQIILDNLNGADQALRESLEAAILDSLKTEEPKLRKAAEKGLLQSSVVPEVNPSQMNAFRMYYKQSADKLNLVNTVMLDSTEQAYRSTVADIVNRINRTQGIMNEATGEVVTGISSWNAAMTNAVKKMVDNGLTGFIDHGGHHWSPEAYTAMDIRTTMFNTARAAVWERADDYGDDLYQVSSHNGARPLCYPWQGKVISRTDNVREVEDLDGNKVHVYAQSETSYGEPAGLFGINCQHYPMSFVPGLSTLRGEPQSPEENEKTYAESQEQRRLERRLREEKRDLEVMQAQGADEEQIKAQRQRVKDASNDIDDFCEQTGRSRKRNRETAPVRATWQTEGGEVTRFDGGYISTNQVPPPKSIVTSPNTGSNVVSQTTTTTLQNDIFKNVKGVDDAFKDGMRQTLEASQNQEAQKLFTKFADQLACTNGNLSSGAFFSPRRGGVSMNVVEVAKGSSYEKPYQTAFHEFGHMIDWLAGGQNNYDYLSNQPVNGVRLLDTIKSDFQTFKKSLNVSKATEVIPILKAENMSESERGNISDILEKCTGVSYPLSLGHGAKYHKHDGATEKEFFAEVLDSSIANQASYKQMQRLFPNAVKMVWEMVKGASK